MKRYLTMGIASLLARTMMAGCTSAMAVSEGTNSVTLEFEKDIVNAAKYFIKVANLNRY